MTLVDPYVRAEPRQRVKSRRGLFPLALATDVLAPLLAIPLAYVTGDAVRAAFGISSGGIDAETIKAHVLLTAALSGILIFWLGARGHYRLRQTFSAQAKDLLIGCAVALVVASFMQYAAKADTSRLLVFGTWMAAAVLMMGGRATARLVGEYFGNWRMRTLFVGSSERRRLFDKVIAKHRDLGYHITGEATEKDLLARLDGLADAEREAALRDLCAENGAEVVVVAPGPGEHERALRIVDMLERLDLDYVFAPDLGHLPVDHVNIQQISPFDGLFLVPQRSLDRPFALLVKRIVESSAALVLLGIALPFFLYCWVAIRRDGGPLFFAQPRIGQNGRLFHCLKFRTMVTDADARLAAHLAADPAAAREWHETQKLRDDPRVTPIGRFLRASSLDELPQLINVLTGDMSLVGPRPVVPGELDRYGVHARYYTKVKPGITGLWQVNGRNGTSYAERVRLDAYYVRNWTLWRDLMILLKTVPEMVWHRSGL